MAAVLSGQAPGRDDITCTLWHSMEGLHIGSPVPEPAEAYAASSTEPIDSMAGQTHAQNLIAFVTASL